MTTETQPDLPAVQNLDRHMTSGEVTKQALIIQEILNKVMIGPTPENPAGIHYGIVPGTKKPTLLQPGAEKICATFRLAPKYHVEDLSEPHNNFYRYRVTCSLHTIRDGLFVGSACGESSSNEEKYQWQAAVCSEEWEMADPTRRRIKFRKTNQGFEQVQQVQRNAADLANTVLKIACKRAHISATRNATAASDLLDVDLDEPAVADLAREEQADQQPVAKPKAKPQPAPEMRYGKHKGKKINDPEVPVDYLRWMADKTKQGLDDPARAKFKQQDQLFLAALDAEIAARHKAEAKPEAQPETRLPLTEEAWDEFRRDMEENYPDAFQSVKEEKKIGSVAALKGDDRWAFYDAMQAKLV